MKNMGRNVLISKRAIFSAPHELSIGNNVFINVGCILHAEGGLSIGDDTKIGPYTTIWTSNHIFDRTDVPIRSQGQAFAPVTIGSDVWIGASVTIVAGVTIGDGAVIGANAVVTKDIAPYAVAVGNPARVISSRLS
jgi:acetyltransferase-like isoleucine patch superfamily enzyme